MQFVQCLCFLRVFPGAVAFQLYSSMGFPLDLLTLMAEEKVLLESWFLLQTRDKRWWEGGTVQNLAPITE